MDTIFGADCEARLPAWNPDGHPHDEETPIKKSQRVEDKGGSKFDPPQSCVTSCAMVAAGKAAAALPVANLC